MSDRIKEIVARESIRTLEKLAFIFAMPEEEEMEPKEGETIDVAVSFNGPFSGSMMILYPSTDLTELAANMLGLDDDDEISGEHKLDALKETINIICGNILPAVGGDAAVFDIDAPVAIEDPGSRPDISGAVKVQLALDEGVCFLYLLFDGDRPEVGPEQ